MEKIFALVKDNKVENLIVAEEAFVSLIKQNWQHCVRVDILDQIPSIGWSYDPVTQLFVAPVVEVTEPEVETEPLS